MRNVLLLILVALVAPALWGTFVNWLMLRLWPRRRRFTDPGSRILSSETEDPFYPNYQI